jgi:hypothetical protein
MVVLYPVFQLLGAAAAKTFQPPASNFKVLLALMKAHQHQLCSFKALETLQLLSGMLVI